MIHSETGSVSVFTASLMSAMGIVVLVVMQGAHLISLQLDLQHRAQQWAVRAAQAELRDEAGCELPPAEFFCESSLNAVHIEVSQEVAIFGHKVRIRAAADEGFGPREQGLSP